MEIWSTILKTNTFNFLVMVGIFWFLIKKFKLGDMLQSEVLKIKNSIDDSKEAKEKSQQELKSAYKEASNVEEKIKEIEQNAKDNILDIEEKYNLESEKQIEAIKNNALKTIEVKRKEAVSSLENKTVSAAVELAKIHIENLLKNNSSYHQKLIDDSIEELDRLLK